MSIEDTQSAADQIEAHIEQEEAIAAAVRKGLRQPDHIRGPSWLDNKLPGTDTVTVGDAMLYTGGAIAIGAIAYGVYRMIKYYQNDGVADAALVGGETISL